MSGPNNADKPQLAAMVQAGEQQIEAVKINDFIFMARDISNAYLVKTGDGDVMINTGFFASPDRNKALFAPHRSGPLQAIFLTQAHADHFGGVPTFKEDATKVIAQEQYTHTEDFFKELGPYLGRRSAKLWAGTVNRGNNAVPYVVPDITFEKALNICFGQRNFEMIATPGGESPDAAAVWLPDDRIVFTGNLFGPVFMSMPNFNTVRGDKPRSVERFLNSLDRIRGLGAEMLITGHGDPIVGADTIRQNLDTLFDAVSYVRNATVEGMNAGKDVYTLMREIQLPDPLQLGEFHGKVSWAVKSIWHEYSGWMMYESTTELYAVPRSSINADLIELAGGAETLAKRAEQKIRDGQPLQALHLADIALSEMPGHSASLRVKRSALEAQLNASGGNNLSEVMWLKSEIAAVENANHD